MIEGSELSEVMVIAPPGDFHAQAIARVLEARHDVTAVILDFGSLDAATFAIDCGGSRSEVWGTKASGEPTLSTLHEVRSVWYRRPRSPRIGHVYHASELPAKDRRELMEGLVWKVRARWVNDLEAGVKASRKAMQLAVAKEVGLPVPETVITSVPEVAEEFIERHRGSVIFKSVDSTPPSFIPTRMWSQERKASLRSLHAHPTIFQQFINAGVDYKVAWIDGIALSISIRSDIGAGWVDSRRDLSVPFRWTNLPQDVESLVNDLMNRLGLKFGIVDLRETPEGEIYFLEVNTQGQFAYLETMSGAPIFDTLASLLARE